MGSRCWPGPAGLLYYVLARDYRCHSSPCFPSFLYISAVQQRKQCCQSTYWLTAFFLNISTKLFIQCNNGIGGHLCRCFDFAFVPHLLQNLLIAKDEFQRNVGDRSTCRKRGDTCICLMRKKASFGSRSFTIIACQFWKILHEDIQIQWLSVFLCM